MTGQALRVFLVSAIVFVAACASSSGPSTAPSAGTQAERQTPKRITVAIRGEPKSVSGKLSLGTVGGVPGQDEIEEMLNAGLANRDRGGTLHPQLAEQMPTVENGLWKLLPDGTMETTWRLREGIVWHDGQPLTSEDLLFTATVEQDGELPIFRNVAYGAIDALLAPDPRTITIKWKRPFLEADTMFTNDRAFPMPKHLLERAFLDDKENFVNLPYWSQNFVGAGAYRLREWSSGIGVSLEANDRYVLGRPIIDRIDVRFIPDPSTIAANILAGEVDLTLGGRLSLEWGAQVRSQWRDGRMDTARPTSMISAYTQFLNPNPVVLLDPRFRRALLHGIDRQQIIDSLVEGLGPMGHAIISPEDNEWPDVESSVVRYEFDTRRAVQMIEGLGYTRASDGIFRDAGGQRLGVEVRTTSNDDSQMKTMFSVADYWQQIGVAVEQVPVPPQRATDREYRATRPGFEIVRQPGNVRELGTRWHGSNTPLPDNDFTGQNRTRHQNPEFDTLIDRFFTTIPRAERIQTLRQIIHYMTDQVVILGIFWDPTPTMVANRLHSITKPGEVWDVHQWDTR
jgi:peptide/nickel transport system substrate-binding protein